jgi:hypothetical protein
MQADRERDRQADRRKRRQKKRPAVKKADRVKSRHREKHRRPEAKKYQEFSVGRKTCCYMSVILKVTTPLYFPAGLIWDKMRSRC